jgi:hypothetical protein
MPTDLTANGCPATLEDLLRPLGLTVSMKTDVVAVEYLNGLRCEDSARYFVPVLFPGLGGPAIAARLIKPGCGEIRIGGQCYPVTSSQTMNIDLEPSSPHAGLDGAVERQARRGARGRRLTKP